MAPLSGPQNGAHRVCRPALCSLGSYARDVLKLLGVADIARLLGITRQRVEQLAQRDDFPEPAGLVGGRRRVWHEADIRRWAKKTGRRVR